MNRAAPRLAVGVVGLALLGGVAGCGLTGGPELKTLTAHFDKTVGVYVHNDVRMLGVKIGEVTAIEPEGRSVRIDMTYDSQYRVPAEAKAVLIAPSIVSDRYVQLTPVYESGPLLADGADIPLEDTAVPVELDQIYSSLDKLNIALGPKGANKGGALSDLLKVGRENLEGNGDLLGSTLTDLSTAVGTLSDQRGDLFDTVRNLQDFTTTLARSDNTVRQFNGDLADVAAQLEGEKESLALAVKQLGVALSEVATFVRDNKKDLTANVKDLASVTRVLVTQKTALEEFLDTSPTALSNLQLAYNPRSGTLDTRDNNSNGQANLSTPLCGLLLAAGQPQSVCDAITSQLPNLPAVPALPAPPALPGASGTTGAAKPGAAPAVSRDLTLGGLLGAGR
ncbi:MAG: hypothetical protein JWM64_2369 [Frankiales bacterium]|nr:hypothetical protein [Frankiales bacterium]